MVPWIALGIVVGQPVVAVFQIQDIAAKRKTELDTLHQLSEYLGGQIAEGGRYRVVPSDDLQRMLQSQKVDSYKNCYQEACQIEVGKALAAEKSLSTQIMRIGSTCIMKSVLFDLAQEVSERVATAKGGCSTDQLIESVEKVAFKLKAEAKASGSSAVLTADPIISDPSLPAVSCSPGESCYQLGLDHRDGKNGRTRDIVLARAHLLEACRRGHGAGCTDLGYIFEKGVLVPEDPYDAAKLYFRGCELGNSIGCTNTGYMYEKGKGVPEDPALAVSYYEKGCDMGNARGCTNLGYMVRNGLGVARDDARARELYQRGCEGGNAGGCTNLGYLYETGQAVPQDARRAVNLYRKGCEGGSGVGCSNLGFMYEHGRGIARNLLKAIRYYQKGCEAGSARGCENLRKLEGS